MQIKYAPYSHNNAKIYSRAVRKINCGQNSVHPKKKMLFSSLKRYFHWIFSPAKKDEAQVKKIEHKFSCQDVRLKNSSL